MNSKKIRLALIIIFTLNSSSAQIVFQKAFGGANMEEGHSVQQTTDGGYIIAGRSKSFGAGNYDIYLIKADINGDLIWTKTFGGTGIDEGYSAKQTADGGYIVTGLTTSFGAGNFDVYLLKTDTNGDSLWTKTFGGIYADAGYSVQQTTDGGFIIAGLTNSFANGESFYLIKTDTLGNLLWTKTFGGGGTDRCFSVQQTTDGGYILTGEANDFGNDEDVYLVKTDSNGDSLWTKTFGGTSIDFGNYVQQTTDGGYIIAGNTLSFGAGSYDIYLIKTDSNGNLLWTKTFGEAGTEYGNSVIQTSDSGYIIAGQSSSFGGGTWEAYLIKTNLNGNLLWSKTFSNLYDDIGFAIQPTSDSGYVFTGLTNFGSGYEVYLVKTDANGNSGCNEGSVATIVTIPATQESNPATIVNAPTSIVTSPPTLVSTGGILTTYCFTLGIAESKNLQSTITVFPNPFTNELEISSTKIKGEVTLYDLSGKVILRQRVPVGGTKLNTTKIAKGFYILHYIEENNIQIIKLTKM